MKCELDYCIYNKDSLCILNEIQLNSLGMCDESIIVSISYLDHFNAYNSVTRASTSRPSPNKYSRHSLTSFPVARSSASLYTDICRL